jgi:hypothetical protein
MSDSGQVTPAGWYPNDGVLRYWDGTGWTEHTAPLPEDAGSSEAKTRDKKAEKAAAREQAAAQAKAAREARKGDALRPDIVAAMSKMSSKIGSKREVKRLPEHLWDDEHVDLITSGTYGPGNGILVLTDRRLFFLKDGMMTKTSEDFPIEKISSIQWTTGMMFGKITVFASGNKAEINNVMKVDGKAITDAVRSRLSGGPRFTPEHPSHAIPTPAPSPTVPAPDVYEQLKKLADLRDAGILTDEEFAAKKQILLDQI